MIKIKIVNKAKETDIYLYGEIGWEVTANQFALVWQQIKANKVNLFVNSPGGDVFEGYAIYNIIKRSDKAVSVFIDGQACSIASMIVQAADNIYMSETALFMIHNPWAGVFGEIKDMEKMIEILDLIEAQLVAVYSGRTGIDEKEIKKMMDEETWLAPEKAKELGFITDTYEGMKAAANTVKKYDLSKYNFKKIDIANNQIQKGEKMKKILAFFKVETEEEALAKINNMAASNAELTTQNATLQSSVDEMTSENATLKTKISDFETAEITALVDKAVSDKKLLPGQKDWALNLAANDRESFDNFLETASVHDLTDPVVLNPGEGEDKDLKWEDIMNDLKARKKLQEEDPERFEKLRDDFHNSN